MKKEGLANELRRMLVDLQSMSAPEQLGTYEKFIDSYARTRAMVEGTPLENEAQPPIDSDRITGAARISTYIETVHVKALLAEREEDYRREYSGQSVEIDSASQETIQTAINALRNAIDSADDLSEEHKSRLLKRLEILQREFHKKQPDLQRMLGTILEVSVVLKNACENLKPYVGPLTLLWEIVTKVLTGLDGLPPATSFPALPAALPAALEDDEGDV